MNLAIDVNKAAATALQGLEEHETHFLIQKVREGISYDLAFELREWYQKELESPRCDMAKVAPLSEASRLLVAVAEEESRVREARLAKALDKFSGETVE